MGAQPAGPQPVVLYVINSFDGGGAEAGLVTLVRAGVFANCQLRIVALVRGNGGLEAELARLGQPPSILVDRARLRGRDLPRVFLRLWRTVARARPQIVIGSLPQANLLARLCVLLRRRTTFVSFEHNSHLAKRAYELGYRWTSRRVDWVLADSAATMVTACRRLYGRVPRRRSVVPLVCFGARAAVPRAGAAAEAFHIVNAARFTATKNQAALVEAVAILADAGRNVVLTLYGEGPERATCEALAERLGVRERVRFPGFVADWASRPADLFALVSRHEGLCIVVLEAMHAGIPVAAPNIGGLRDYAAADMFHELASVDAATVAREIAAAIDNRAGSRLQAVAAAAMVDRRFGAAVVAEHYAELNQALLAAQRSPSAVQRAVLDRRNAASVT